MTEEKPKIEAPEVAGCLIATPIVVVAVLCIVAIFVAPVLLVLWLAKVVLS